MQMQVVDGLSAVGTGVDHQAKTVVEVLLLRDFIGCLKEFAKKFGFSWRCMCK